MKFEYIKPELEELELVIEGSFLNDASPNKKPDPTNPDLGVEEGEGGGDGNDNYWD